MGKEKKEFLKWRFDVNTFRLIGRDLITDRITAVYELVKNCYDANATEVTIDFSNVSKPSNLSTIKVIDNGFGMSFEDIRDKWMVVGTASKRTEKISPPPFRRRYVGEKGIGRFAVDKLGGKLVIETKKSGEQKKLNVEINWEKYEELSKSPQLELFTEVENYYYYENADPKSKGTTLIITSLNERWDEYDLDRLNKELSKVISPLYPVNPPFKIYLNSNEFTKYSNQLVQSDAVKYSSHHFVLKFDRELDSQETLTFNENLGKVVKASVPIKSFGPIGLDLYYFDEIAKRKYNTIYKNDDARIDGIKIYRDGVVTTPFAEFEAARDKKRDILGIDKRLWTGIFDKIGTREIIGVLNITKDDNPNIIDATNRQDFVDNAQYRALKEFVLGQLDILSQLKIHERGARKLNTTESLKKAGEDVKLFTKAIVDLATEEPKLKKYLEPLKEQAKKVNKAIAKGISDQKKSEEDFVRKENVYLSLMSLQEYAIHVSHAVRTSLGKTKRMAEFFKRNFPNTKYDSVFKEYSILIFDELSNLNKVIDFMLSYASSNMDFEDFNAKQLLENLFSNSYKEVFNTENIRFVIEIPDNFVINGNKKFFEDIFQNLISNSVKALKNCSDKIIKCAAHLEKDHFVVYFSDNGTGIPEELKEKVFEIFFTTTAEEGGAGLGLFIAKTRIQALRGTIEVADSQIDSGATFKMSFPFKKD